ncbi:spidroin-1 [Bos mutus]|uniref:spidroin-1 n=1 Tax=Bos mutus TaxID=72004 RepID=UPI0038B688C2
MEPAGARAAPAAGSGGVGERRLAGAGGRPEAGSPRRARGLRRSVSEQRRWRAGRGAAARGRAAGPGGRVRVREGGFGFPAAEGAWRCRPGPRARAPGGEAGSVSGGHRHVFPAAAAQAEVSGGAGRARPGGGRRPRGSRRARPAQSRAAAEARARSASRAQLVPAAGGGRGAARLCAGPGSPRCGLEPRPGKLGQTASPRAGREVRARGGPGGLGHAGRRRRRARVFGARKGRGAIGVPGWSPQPGVDEQWIHLEQPCSKNTPRISPCCGNGELIPVTCGISEPPRFQTLDNLSVEVQRLFLPILFWMLRSWNAMAGMVLACSLPLAPPKYCCCCC